MSNSSLTWFSVDGNGRILSSLIAQQYGLPEPKVFARDGYNMAFPQIVLWVSAIGGILLVSLIIKSFLSRG